MPPGPPPLSRTRKPLRRPARMLPRLARPSQNPGGGLRGISVSALSLFHHFARLPLVADKSILVPCLHHESYAYLPLVATAFARARRVLFLSEGEARLATRIFGFGGWSRSSVAGAGVDISPLVASEQKVELGTLGRFVLCLGQGSGQEHRPGRPAYAAYRAGHANTRLDLVLAGPGEAALPADRTGILSLGTVSETDKHRLLSECAALFNPSIHESYSRVLMEAWHHSRPVVVHADCLATTTAVQDSGGGWVAGGEGWIRCFCPHRSPDAGPTGDRRRPAASTRRNTADGIGRSSATRLRFATSSTP